MNELIFAIQQGEAAEVREARIAQRDEEAAAKQEKKSKKRGIPLGDQMFCLKWKGLSYLHTAWYTQAQVF